MLRKTNLLIALLILNISISMAQNVKLGFRIEPSLLITDTENLYTPYSLYTTLLYRPIECLDIEWRPGFLFAGEKYSGFEMGAFANYRFVPTKFFISFGLNNHSNLGYGRNGFGSYSKDVFYLGFGLGIQSDEKLKFDIMYYYPTSGVYAYSISSYGISTTEFGVKINEKKMVGILKVGFSLAWDIF